ncbi:MAG: hypothetical protein J07HQW1_02474 [Haloquadratum walsbyi J07HQW1]|uniref:Uncharacterized protein n=1 Tax=Haloquadratum walsbyi J07HQW1 TaxID=1238424 RepID=U1N6Z4_9EURY|nr:MAG: hypothetical protein J07HQW1_02474 [Haloquadratum walsbyi J07HQW1]
MITVVENTPILFSSASKLWLLRGLPPRWRLSKHANPHKIIIEDIDRDVFVRIQTDPLVVGDSIMTDRYHASNGCVIFDLFGGFGNRPRKVMGCPIKCPFERGRHSRAARGSLPAAEPECCLPERGRQPGTAPGRRTGRCGESGGCWHLSFREAKPEFVALLVEAIDYLDAHKTDFIHQLGGARSFGGGIVDCEL